MKTIEKAKQKAKSRQEILASINTLKQCINTIKNHNRPIKDSRKLSARAKLDALCDDPNDCIELSPLAGHNCYPGVDLPAGGLITAIVRFANQWCMVFINDPAIKAGTFFPITIKKYLRAQTIAMENRLPCLYVVDSGGAYLPLQQELFADRNYFGRIFYQQAQLSAQGIFQLAIVVGSCTAGGAYVPGMADETIMVNQQAQLFLAGPPLVEAATGERIDAEALGGASLHAQSGTISHVVDNEQEAYTMARCLINRLPKPHALSKKHFLKPKKTDLYSCLPTHPRDSFDACGILDALCDSDTQVPFQPQFGQSLKTAFASIGGHEVGILINDGVLFSHAASKGAAFIQACELRNLPLIFLQNINGFMVGQQEERQGIIRQGASLVRAIATSKLPKLTIIMGGSYGAGNYAMCGRAYDPRFLWIWPSAKIGIMGPDQAAFVLNHINSHHDTDSIKTQFNKQASPYYSSAHLWDDGIIDPNETRTYLITALNLIEQSEEKNHRER
jgi:3-methylcrotonyl-CoA carboxylase beta subunit